MAAPLLPTDKGPLQIVAQDGTVIATLNGAQINTVNNMVGGSGGNNSSMLQTLGQAVQLGGGVIELAELSSIRQDISDARKKVATADTNLSTYLTGLGSSPIDAGKLNTLFIAQGNAQDDLDSAQNDGFTTLFDMLFIQVGGSGLTMVGAMQGGQGGGLGQLLGGGSSNGTEELLLGAGVGALASWALGGTSSRISSRRRSGT